MEYNFSLELTVRVLANLKNPTSFAKLQRSKEQG
jgi:hypothetical protein